jgi:hypothetical protein
MRSLSTEAYGTLLDSMALAPPTGSKDTDDISTTPESAEQAAAPSVRSEGAHASASDGGMSANEMSALRSLALFTDTPRTAKRLFNLYRLVKVLVGPVASPSFAESGYQIVLLELAVASGYPDLSKDFFGYLIASPGREFWALVDDLRPRDLSTGVGNSVAQSLSNEEARRWRALVEAVLSLRATFRVATPDAIAWASLTQRFTFAGPAIGA